MSTVSNQKRTYQQRARALSQATTRARIAAAAASLHVEVGIARTTVSDIARRAGVQRLTVYNHFPDLQALLPACSAHWLGEHPMPDLGAALADPDPEQRLRSVLTALYGWYEPNARMQERVNGERAIVPELDSHMAESADVLMAGLVNALAAGLDAERRPLIALAVDFWTWRRFHVEEISVDAAAGLMTRAVFATGSTPVRLREELGR